MHKQFNDLYAFIQVARLESFTKAAKLLGVTPSALSHAMNHLEQRLNVKLLNRTTRTTVPTEAGQQLLTRLEPMFISIASELDELGRFNDTVKGNIRINAPEVAAFYTLYPKLAEFSRDYPDVSWELCVDNLKDNIVAQRFDLGVRLGNDLAQDMVAVQISPPLIMSLVASPDYLARHSTPQKPDDLHRHRCIGLAVGNTGATIDWQFQRRGKRHTLSSGFALRVNVGQLSKQAALDGLGIAWTPTDYVRSELEQGALAELLPDWQIQYTPLFLYYPRNRQKSQTLELLIERLRFKA